MLVFVEKNNIIGTHNCPCYYHSECKVAATLHSRFNIACGLVHKYIYTIVARSYTSQLRMLIFVILS